MGKVLVKSEVFAKYSQILEGGGCSILLRKSAVECFLIVPRHLKFLKNLLTHENLSHNSLRQGPPTLLTYNYYLYDIKS